MTDTTRAAREPEVRRRWLDLATIAHPQLKRVYEYWKAIKGERLAPARRDIDPIDLREVLPGTLLIDVGRDPWRFSYRLAGTLTERIHGVDLTGRSIDMLKPQAFADMLRADLIELSERVEPQLVYLEFINQMGVQRGYQVLRLPLSSDGSTVDMILIVTDYGGDYRGLAKFLEEMSGKG
jgi:hypothetical protein